MNLLNGLPEIKSMSPETEAALARKKTDSAKTEIVLANMREAFLYCKTCCRSTLTDEEIFSLCYEALQKTALKFDPKKGRFFAYSKVYLRGQISRAWKEKDVVKNASLHETIGAFKNSTRLSHQPDSYECGEWSDPDLVDWDDHPLNFTNASEPGFDSIHTAERWAIIQSALGKLSERERMVVELIFRSGFRKQKIGDMLGISRQAVIMLLTRAIRKIRSELIRKKKLSL